MSAGRNCFDMLNYPNKLIGPFTPIRPGSVLCSLARPNPLSHRGRIVGRLRRRGNARRILSCLLVSASRLLKTNAVTRYAQVRKGIWEVHCGCRADSVGTTHSRNNPRRCLQLCLGAGPRRNREDIERTTAASPSVPINHRCIKNGIVSAKKGEGRSG